jgi:hypothetical protein
MKGLLERYIPYLEHIYVHEINEWEEKYKKSEDERDKEHLEHLINE